MLYTDGTMTEKAKGLIANEIGVNGIKNAVAPTFDTSTAYTAGQYMWYDGNLYRFTTDHAAGSWNAAQVELAVVANDLAGDVSDLKSQINRLAGTIGSNALEQYLYKKDTYFNASLVETKLTGYNTYKIPVDKIVFIFEKWTGETSPVYNLGSTTYHYVCENSNGVVSRSLSGADWKISQSYKHIVFIIPNDCKYLYLTIYANVVPDISLLADYPYQGFTENDFNRNFVWTINDATAIHTHAYRSTNTIEFLNGEYAYWLPVKKGDQVKLATNSISGFSFVAEFIDKTTGSVTRYGPGYETSLEPTFNNNGILIIMEDDTHSGNATFYPVSRFDTYDKQNESIKSLEQDVEALERNVEVIENKLDAEPVNYTTGTVSGRYCKLIANSDTELEIKAGTNFSYSKIDVEEWMYEVDFSVLSVTGIAVSTSIFCGFADEDNLLISRNPVVVGQYRMPIPSNAKYIYLNFFGSAFCEGYAIKSDPFAKNSQIEQLQAEIDNLDANPFDGLSGVAFGTSLTYRAQTTGGYLQYLTDMIGITFDNQGIGSSYIYGNMLTAIKGYTGYAGKRVCLLEGFVNDWYYNKTLGTWRDTTETSVCGCVRSALNYMLSKNANLTIFLILDPYGRNYSNIDCSTTAINGAGLTQYEYYEEIAKVAESLGIPVIKEYAESQISENTPQYLVDNIHPTALGAKQSANCIWSVMRGHIPNAIS